MQLVSFLPLVYGGTSTVRLSILLSWQLLSHSNFTQNVHSVFKFEKEEAYFPFTTYKALLQTSLRQNHF